MHVVMLVDAVYEDRVGGSRVVARELARGLASRGHRVTFVAPDLRGGERGAQELEEELAHYRIRRFRHHGPVSLMVRGGPSRGTCKPRQPTWSTTSHRGLDVSPGCSTRALIGTTPSWGPEVSTRSGPPGAR